MAGLGAPASADDLPPLGELFVMTRSGGLGVGPGAGRGRALACLGRCGCVSGLPGCCPLQLAASLSVTESAGRISAGLSAPGPGPPSVLLEHHPAAGSGEGIETLDLVRIRTDRKPRSSRVWPTPQESPRHAGLERVDGRLRAPVISRPASWFDWRDDDNR